MVSQEDVLRIIREYGKPITIPEIVEIMGAQPCRDRSSLTAEVGARCRQLQKRRDIVQLTEGVGVKIWTIREECIDGQEAFE